MFYLNSGWLGQWLDWEVLTVSMALIYGYPVELLTMGTVGLRSPPQLLGQFCKGEHERMIFLRNRTPKDTQFSLLLTQHPEI